MKKRGGPLRARVCAARGRSRRCAPEITRNTFDTYTMNEEDSQAKEGHLRVSCSARVISQPHEFWKFPQFGYSHALYALSHLFHRSDSPRLWPPISLVHIVIPNGEGLNQECKVLRPRFGNSCKKEQILDQPLFPSVPRGIGMRFDSLIRPRLHTSQSEEKMKELRIKQDRDRTGCFHHVPFLPLYAASTFDSHDVWRR